MPCYEVNLISVQFKIENLEILKSAAALLSWNFAKYGNIVKVGPVNIYLSQSKAESSTQENINTLKRAYSQAAVKAAAKAKGWTLDGWKEKANIKTTVAIKY
jgi:hypothetical protein